MQRNLVYKILVGVFLVIAIVWSLFPVYWMVITAFGARTHITPPQWIFVPRLDNFRELIHNSPFVQNFKNTLIVSSVTTVTSLLFGVLAAYSFSRFTFRGSSALPLMFLVIRMVPRIAIVIPYYMLMSWLGLLDTYTSLITSYTTFALPFVVWMMIGFFKEIPVDLEESAQIDGCTRFAAMYRVVLPLVKPGIIATGIFTFLLGWNEFVTSLVLSGRSTRTLPVMIAGFVTDRDIAWGAMSASGTLIILPIMVSAMYLQKHIVRGLSMGAVKG